MTAYSTTSRPAGGGALIAALALALLAAPGLAAATGFLPVIDDIPDTGLHIQTVDGHEIVGDLRGFSRGTHGYRKLIIQADDGSRHKLKVEEIERLSTAVFGPALAAEAVDSVREAANTDWETLGEARELVWDRLTPPGRKKPYLYQRLNPGFDTRIRVYGLPGRETGGFESGNGIRFFGGLPKAYLVVKDGGPPVEVTRGDYKKQAFHHLFSDCPAVAERFGDDERGFRRFADHVYFYEVSCR